MTKNPAGNSAGADKPFDALTASPAAVTAELRRIDLAHRDAIHVASGAQFVAALTKRFGSSRDR